MNTTDYQRMYDDLTNQLNELRERRAAMEATLGDLSKEIDSLEQTTKHLGPLAGFMDIFAYEELGGVGITDAVRYVLDPKERFSVAEIKSRMEKRGFNFSSYSAPNSSISTILRRLVEAEEAQVEKEGWNTFYKSLPTDEDIPS